ncbi:MAG: 1,4-dihydroxy-6-naphthoate synthase [Planctomycetes bacterium]|nr:1,4-dihydroxy-6-naphthoate synthase [Planctomycetota bacterium]
MSRIRLGISTCPNDTFAFHGILSGSVDAHGLEFDIKLMDVEELNRGLATDTFDVAKASFATALRAARDWLVLPSGSALGFGVGPVLLSATASIPVHPRVLLPGEGTTAAMLYALLRQDVGEIRHAVFNQIMPALERGDADLGVCIHEGRFTYASRGLHLVEDLGERWEQETGVPLPLGGILARRNLGPDILARVQSAVRASLQHGLANRDKALSTMRRHAQELDDAVIWSHVDLYVNEWTLDLGDRGRAALNVLSKRGREAGFVAADVPPLQVLGS